MRAIVSAVFIVSAVPLVASAQPGQTPAAPDPYPQPQPQPAPQPYPPPPPQQPWGPGQQPPPPNMAPAPYAYVPVALSADDQALLAQGEISDGAHVGGAVASVFFGFGIGQAVQGRYGETGWIFTLGEAASLTALVVGAVQSFDACVSDIASNCNNQHDGEGLMIAGLIGIVGFRVWEVADAFGGPPKHNRRVRELRMRLGIPQPMYTQKLTPYLHKTHDGGSVAGLSLRF